MIKSLPPLDCPGSLSAVITVSRPMCQPWLLPPPWPAVCPPPPSPPSQASALRNRSWWGGRKGLTGLAELCTGCCVRRTLSLSCDNSSVSLLSPPPNVPAPFLGKVSPQKPFKTFHFLRDKAQESWHGLPMSSRGRHPPLPGPAALLSLGRAHCSLRDLQPFPDRLCSFHTPRCTSANSDTSAWNHCPPSYCAGGQACVRSGHRVRKGLSSPLREAMRPSLDSVRAAGWPCGERDGCGFTPRRCEVVFNCGVLCVSWKTSGVACLFF